MTPFEAIVFRYMPDEGAGELLNVGLAMRACDGTFFKVELIDSWTRVTDAFPSAHARTVRQVFVRLRDALNTSARNGQAALIATRLEEELLRLVPSPDGSVKWSPAIEGATADMTQTFRRLMFRYVEQHEKERIVRPSRSDEEVEEGFIHALERRGNLQVHLQPRTLKGLKRKHFEVEIAHCWLNGKWNCVQPLSLDLLQPRDIQNKAATWIGNVRVLSPSEQESKLVLFVGLPPESRREAREAANDALAALKDEVSDEAEVIEEDQADVLAERMATDLRH